MINYPKVTQSAQAGTMLVIGAHAADFVWRAAGAVAMHTGSGGRAVVVALSYGERGESGDLWREADQSVDRVKRIRHDEASRAADALGAELLAFDLGDYPLEVNTQTLLRLADLMRELAPELIVTHTPTDPFNPDHPVASAVTERARKLAMGAGGAPAAFPTIKPPRLYYFEPHQPEHSGFLPTTYIDFTQVVARKEQAMAAIASQTYLRDHYRQRSEQRAYQARYFGAGIDVRNVEAFQLANPVIADFL
jgi:4-oxalomesaconate hydratase